MASGNQEPWIAWQQRNVELCKKVDAGEVECCGAWKQKGYRGWCELVTKPNVMLRRGGQMVLVRRCPRADQEQRIGEWFAELVDELDELCKGDSEWLLS